MFTVDEYIGHHALRYDSSSWHHFDKNFRCAVCKNVTNCNIDYPSDDIPCGYELVDKDEIRNKLFKQFDRCRKIFKKDNSRDSRITDHLFQIYSGTFKGTTLDIYDMAIDHKICPFCNGSGTIINDRIQPCMECRGSGIVDCYVPEGYVVNYISYERTDDPNDSNVHMIQMHGIHNTQEQAEDRKSVV